MRGEDDATERPPLVEPPVRAGLIGCGTWGQALLTAMAELPRDPTVACVQAVALCDVDPTTLRGAAAKAPRARLCSDYRAVLDDPRVELVLIATPTHVRLPLVLDALATGKHVWCETPLAQTLPDARRIALAGAAHSAVFATGLLRRCHLTSRRVADAFRAQELGELVEFRAQCRRHWLARYRHDAERCRAVNWLWQSDTSLGLVGEWGVEAFDLALWYCQRGLPVSVRGWSRGVLTPDDERALYDEGGCEVRFADGLPLRFHASAVAEFGGSDFVAQGGAGSLWLRGGQAHERREQGARNTGWQPYARQDRLFDEVYYALADVSHRPLTGDLRVQGTWPQTDALIWQAHHIRTGAPPAVGYWGPAPRLRSAADAYRATVLAIRAGQAARERTTLKLDPADFELA